MFRNKGIFSLLHVYTGAGTLAEVFAEYIYTVLPQHSIIVMHLFKAYLPKGHHVLTEIVAIALQTAN